MFFVTLIMITRKWKHPTCLSTDKRIMKILYAYTVEFRSTVKKNLVIKYAGKLMELEILVLRSVLPFVWILDVNF